MDFVEICNVYMGKMIIKAAKRIFNSDKIWRSYSDLNFGVTFLEHSVDSFFVTPTNSTELMKIIINFNNSRSPGYDNIGSSLIKDVSAVIIDPIVYII